MTEDTERRRLALVVDARGADTILGASLCAACPHSAAGCCVAPPRMDWSDLARVVAHGGRDWVLAQIAAKNLVSAARGLSLRRVKGLAGRGGPRVAKCVFHDAERGCTIAHDRRPATCNYYVCESVLEDAREVGREDAVTHARKVQAELIEAFVRWDEELDREILAAHGGSPTLDVAFLEWLSDRWRKLASNERSSHEGC